MSAVIADEGGDGGGGAAGGEPVAPADDESGILAQRAAREIVLATAPRNRGAKLGHGGRAAKGVEAAESPDAQKQPCSGQLRGDFSGRVEDAGSNRITDGRGHPEPHAENFQQPPAALGRCRRHRAGRQFSPPRPSGCGSNKAAIIAGRTEIASWHWSCHGTRRIATRSAISAWCAYEIPLAPGERFMHRNKMRSDRKST